MRPPTTQRILQSLVPALLGTLATALVTLASYWLQPGAVPVALLYVFVVVMVSLRGDLYASVWVSLLAVAVLDYFFTAPLFRLYPVREARDLIVLIGFLTTAVVINRLIARMHQSFRDVEAAQEQLRLVIDTVPTLLSSARADGQVEFVNKGWRDFGGLSVEEVKGWRWVDALHPDDQARFVGDYRAALASGVPFESEARLRRADGEYRWVLLRAVPFRDPHGTIVQWYGAADDIEDWKRAEEKVRQADRERQTVIDTIPALVWSSLPDGSSDFNNERWLEYTGLSEEEARDWGYKSVFHPEDYQRLVTKWAEHFATGVPIEDEARMRRTDGQYRWFLHRAVPLPDESGSIVKWYGTSTDIEDRKRAEESLRDHARLLDLTHDTVFVRDLDDAITYWNRGAEARYGWSREEAIGQKSHQLMQTQFPEALGRMNEELLRTNRWEGELVHTTRDGVRVVVASRWALQRNELGQPVAILETNNDVTERKRAEAELGKSEGRYRHIFQTAGVSIWEEDFTEVKAAIDQLKAEGVTNFREYLTAHPDFVLQAISMVKVIDVNDTTLTLLQARSKDELLVSLHRIFLPETHDTFAEELIAIAEGRTRFEAEAVLQTIEGKRVSILFTIVFPDDSAAFDSVLVSMMDITERKRLDNELRRSQAFLIAAQELGNTGSWARRISTGEMYWSEEVFRIVGLDPGTTVPTRSLATQLWHPKDRERADRTIDEAAREKRSYEMDVRIVRPDGSIRHVHMRGQPVSDQSGVTDEFIGVIMDITQRKRTERALRRARERALETHFTAVLEERTRLARDIHDTLLQGFTGIALKLVAATGRVTEPPESVTALRDLIGLAQQTLIEARRAVWDLRAPSLGGADLSATLRNAAEDCVRGTELRFEYAVGGPPRPVEPEIEAVMVRVLQEAITNTVKHAMAGSVRVRLSFEGRGVRLSVIDDGSGFIIDPELRSYGGHWGLLGMRERATQVHGKLSLRSTPGHGTELVLLVPYTAAQSPVVQSTSSRS
jgi:PAS domain S-box-containing protein